jgi:hypothetical protein
MVVRNCSEGEQYCTELQKKIGNLFAISETAFFQTQLSPRDYDKSLGLDLGGPNEETRVCKHLGRYRHDVGSIRSTWARLARRNGNHAAE